MPTGPAPTTTTRCCDPDPTISSALPSLYCGLLRRLEPEIAGNHPLALGFRKDQLLELFRRARHRIDADARQALLENRVLLRDGDLFRNRVDDILRRAGRRQQSVPGHHVRALQ